MQTKGPKISGMSGLRLPAAPRPTPTGPDSGSAISGGLTGGGAGQVSSGTGPAGRRETGRTWEGEPWEVVMPSPLGRATGAESAGADLMPHRLGRAPPTDRSPWSGER